LVLLHCAFDRFFRVGMEQWVPRLSREHIPQASHWVLLECPDEAAHMVLSWLQNHLPELGKTSKL